MTKTSSFASVSTKLHRIAQLARESPGMVFTTLAHHIDIEHLQEAYRRTRKSGAPGVDGQEAEQYAENLEENLRGLLDRFKSGTYKAPPVLRAFIPKEDGRKRPIGIPTFEDKVLQRAVVMVLEAVYEQDFLDCSYGYRPKRSAHDALGVLWKGLMDMGGGWVYEVDVEGFFDHLDHGHLRSFLDQRVRDGVLRRAIDKWLKAGVLEQGGVVHPELGTPQGGVISPLLANIYLHEVLDRWFQAEVLPRLRGHAFLIRYADDFVIVFSREADARRVQDVLPKRFGKYGLKLSAEKTRLGSFRRPSWPPGAKPPSGCEEPVSFDLLGFTHYWRRSRRGWWVVARKTMTSRLSRMLKRVNQWCRKHRHRKVGEQQKALGMKLRGFYGYFGVTGNADALRSCLRGVQHRWRKWLDRRSQRARMTWERFDRLLKRYPLPPPVVVHSIYRS